MDDSGIVRRGEPVGGLSRDPEERSDRKWTRDQPLAQGFAIDQFHGEVGLSSFALADVVDRDDVRMVERGGRTGLRLKPDQPFAVLRKRFGQDLDGDDTSEPRVFRPVDLAHPAGAEGRQDLVRAEPRSRRKRHVGEAYNGRIRADRVEALPLPEVRAPVRHESDLRRGSVSVRNREEEPLSVARRVERAAGRRLPAEDRPGRAEA